MKSQKTLGIDQSASPFFQTTAGNSHPQPAISSSRTGHQAVPSRSTMEAVPGFGRRHSMWRLLFAVDLVRVEHFFAFGDDLTGGRINSSEKAAAVARVAGRSANLMDAQQDGVGIAVEVHGF